MDNNTKMPISYLKSLSDYTPHLEDLNIHLVCYGLFETVVNFDV